MRTEDRLKKQAVRDCAWHGLQLSETAAAEIAHPLYVEGIEAGLRDDLSQQPQALDGVLAKRRQRNGRRVGADLGPQPGTDPIERPVELQRRSLNAPVVEEVRRERYKAGMVNGIRRRPDRHTQRAGHDRRAGMLDRAEAQT